MATPNMKELGATGLRRFGGTLDEEFLPQLKGEKAVRVFTEMSQNDPVVGAALHAIDMLVRGVEWRTEPAEDGTEDERTEFVEQCRTDLSHSWEAFVSEVLTMLPFGWSAFEIVYKRRAGEDGEHPSKFTDGRFGWRKFAVRGQDSLLEWMFDENGGLEGMRQNPPPDYNTREIAIEKMLLFRTKHRKGSPEGVSVLRNAYRPWFFKKRIEEIQGIGIERDLAGLPVVYCPPHLFDSNASSDDKAIFNAIKDIATRIKRDEQEGVVFPMSFDAEGNPLYKIELLSTGGQRQFDTKAILEYYDARVAMTMLADFILIGHEKVGSFALSSDKTDLFAIALGAYLDEIQSVLNRFAIPRLLRANGMPADSPPRIVHGDIERVDFEQLTNALKNLAASGAPLWPDDDLSNYVRRQGGLPEQAMEDVA